VLVCYLDDSGTGDDSPIVTMAGYIGTLHAWATFEHNAKDVFARFGVKELHGKEFNATKGDFSGWSKAKKESFTAHLYLCLKRSAEYGVSFLVARSAYHKARFEVGQSPRESAYGHCFQTVVDAIMRSVVTERYVAQFQATVSFVVEAGNKNDADIVRIFNEIKLSPAHIGIDKVLKSVSFVKKGSTIALQMADFLAYHVRRHALHCERAKKYLPLSDIQKVIFLSVPTAAGVSHEYRTNEEIKAGLKDPKGWREESPWR